MYILVVRKTFFLTKILSVYMCTTIQISPNKTPQHVKSKKSLMPERRQQIHSVRLGLALKTDKAKVHSSSSSLQMYGRVFFSFSYVSLSTSIHSERCDVCSPLGMKCFFLTANIININQFKNRMCVEYIFII